MLSKTRLAALALAAAFTVGGSAQAATVQTLASYPHGAFLENLTVDKAGTVFFTSYFDKALLALPRDGKAAVFAALPVHPVGVLQTPDGFILTAHKIPFIKAPDFLSSNVVVFLDTKGAVVRTIDATDGRFLNGLVQVGPDKVLIADSVAGLIWALTPSTGAMKPWLADPALTLDPAVSPFRPGANGLKIHDGRLYVSNSSRGAIYRLPLTADGEPGGAVTAFVTPGPIDDFAFAPDGAIYASTHGAKLLKIAPDAAVSTVLETGCDSCTSVAVVGTAKAPSVIVLTTGNFVEGGDTPARVLLVKPGN